MKAAFLYLPPGLLFAWNMVACTKQSTLPNEEFVVEAQKDGTNWVEPGTGTYVRSTRKFYVFGQNSKLLDRQEYLRLSFLLSPEQQNTKVQSFPAEWGVLVGGDAVSNSYSTVDSSSLPSIQITRLDTIEKIVEGRFEATLRRDKHWSQQAEKMQFTNGSFRVRYQEFLQ